MRHNVHVPFAATLAVALLAGCQSSSSENAVAEARDDQIKAEEKVAVAEVQPRAADEKVSKIPALSDDELRRAEAAFFASRDALRWRTQQRLEALSQKADKLENDLALTGDRTYVEMSAAMSEIDGTREAVKRDLRTLSVISSAELQAMDDTIQGHLDELDQAIRDVSTRLSQ